MSSRSPIAPRRTKAKKSAPDTSREPTKPFSEYTTQERNVFIVKHTRLVHMIANKFKWHGVDYEDLVQEGNLGLLRATELFDPTKNTKFSTYAAWWIRAKINRFVTAQRNEIAPSMHGVASELSEQDGRKHYPKAYMVRLDQPVRFDRGRNESTLMVQLTEGDGIGDSLGNFVSDGHQIEEQVTSHASVTNMLTALWRVCHQMDDPRLVTLIRYRLLSDPPETLERVGDRMQLSRETIRQLEKKLLAAVRADLLGK